MGGKEFEYMISDFYNPPVSFTDKYVIKEIPAFTWAVFPCDRPMPDAFRNIHKKYFQNGFRLLKNTNLLQGIALRNMMIRQTIKTESWTPIITVKFGYPSEKYKIKIYQI